MHATGLASTWLSCRDREKKKPLSVSHPTSRSSLMSSRIQRTRAQCVVLLSALSCEKSQKKMAIIGVIGRRIDRLIVHIRAYVRVCMFRKPVKPPATSSCTNDLLIAWYSSSNMLFRFLLRLFCCLQAWELLLCLRMGYSMQWNSGRPLCSALAHGYLAGSIIWQRAIWVKNTSNYSMDELVAAAALRDSIILATRSRRKRSKGKW